ncbi:MAG: alanine--tRNA ligase [Chloroflexi bacterium]|nr:alanine--tRNA ligase [Chloroflexota bacterium]
MNIRVPPSLTGAQVRQSFLDFFAERGHTIVPSASLIPADDPTLLFTNSGMVQFKDVFLNTGTRPYRRAADSQKSMRVAGKHNDLDDVGRDDTHHTFFEMLGNWSFGDYYKQDAIAWAWQLLTGVWGLPKDRLWATCFRDEQGIVPEDAEAAQCWLQQPGFDPQHLLFFGRKDNFWEMAEVGPCGPDSEIHLDRGPEFCNCAAVPGQTCAVNSGCARYLELWNLVFIQYNRHSPTQLEPLPAKHVDTGMGLERIVSVLQNVNSNYRTDLFTPILQRIQQLAGHSDAQREANLTPYRVIADHARAAAFLIADGVIPGNTGRNYVCRMIIRRAHRFGHEIGFHDPFLARVTAAVITEYSAAYPELERQQLAIARTLTDEELRFQRTVDQGVAQLETLTDEMLRSKEAQLDGARAFDLYATYGLPLEITRDLLRKRELGVDEIGFRAALEEHKLISGAGQAMGTKDAGAAQKYAQLLAELQAASVLPESGVEHEPHGALESSETLAALLVNGKSLATASQGTKVEIILTRTPFYVESGGQVGDTGTIHGPNNAWEIQVERAQRPVGGLIVHSGTVVAGEPRTQDSATARVDAAQRAATACNHTATHLLQAQLRRQLGGHVRQAGSLVAPDRLRFDFSHNGGLSAAERAEIAGAVQRTIAENLPVSISHEARASAIASGAMALFGEKYGEIVRTVRIGSAAAPVSLELCGGTHVKNTGQLGAFVILSEGAIAAGVRRIEAIAGPAAIDYLQRQAALVEQIAGQLQVPAAGAAQKVGELLASHSLMQRERDELKRSALFTQLETARARTQTIAGVAFLAERLQIDDLHYLRDAGEWFRAAHPSGVAVFGSVVDGAPGLVVAVTQDLVDRGLNAGKMINTVAAVVGGRGGGKPTLAQAGGKDATQLDAALASAASLVRDFLAG